jgi:L-2-hydroxyglutarate oxidase LhgO
VGFDIIVIGGGVVGLWTALLAARSGQSVALVEQCDRLGSMSSSRNSGVLHGGIYYAPGSLKATHCVRGRHLSVAFLREEGVPFSICGKYIVPAATREGNEPISQDEEYGALETLRELAQANGVEEVAIVRADQPFLQAEWALSVRCTGIVDLPAYVAALERVVRNNGVDIYRNHTCIAGEAGRVVIRNNGGDSVDDEITLTAPAIVNSAGLYADTVAALFGLTGFEVRPNKGSYFQLRSPLPVQTLVYPLPAQHSTFLGVHYTPDMTGTAWVGPNSAWAESKADFTPEGDREAFFGGLSRIVRNNYTVDDLIGPSKVGIRARLYEKGTACTDFVIREYPEGVCHLLGIESPGLTAAPSLAREVLG